jgi:hypothetical protein
LGVAGVAAHGQVDGMNVSLLQFEKGQSNKGTLSEASRRQQEHLLAICQVSNQLCEFVGAVDKVGVVDDFAKNEGIFQKSHITLVSVTLNGVISKSQKTEAFISFVVQKSSIRCFDL